MRTTADFMPQYGWLPKSKGKSFARLGTAWISWSQHFPEDAGLLLPSITRSSRQLSHNNGGSMLVQPCVNCVLCESEVMLVLHETGMTLQSLAMQELLPQPNLANRWKSLVVFVCEWKGRKKMGSYIDMGWADTHTGWEQFAPMTSVISR